MHIERLQRTGTRARVDTVHLRKAINQAKGLHELLPLVIILSRETASMMNDRRLTESDIHRIVVPLAKIRFLLTSIATSGCGSGDVSQEDALVSELVERYLNIEGRIKEMRNDLARAKKPCVP